MNSVRQWLGEEWVYALAWTLIHSVWQIGLLALVVAFVASLGRHLSPVKKYRLYSGAFFTVPLMSLATLWAMYHEAVRLNAPVPQFNLGAFDMPGSIDAVTREVVNPSVMETLLAWISPDKLNLPFIVGIWLVGVLLFSLRFAGGLFAVRRLRKSAAKGCPPEWEAKLSKLADQLGMRRAVKLAESALVSVPMTAGWFKPVILLPVGMLMGIPASQVEMIVLHELAHIKRHDYLVNLAQSVMEILFFYHPAVWWMSDAMRREREHCCDEKVVSVKGDPLAYAKALHMAAMAARSRRAGSAYSVPQTGLALSGPEGELLERIHRILNKEMKKTIYSTRFAASAVMVLGLSILLLVLPSDHGAAVDENGVTTAEAFTSSSSSLSLSGSQTVQSNPVLNSAVADTVPPKNREVVITRNEHGTVTELYVNGKLIPRSDYHLYADVLEKHGGSSQPSVPPVPPSSRSWSGSIPNMPTPPTPPAVHGVTPSTPPVPPSWRGSLNMPAVPTPPKVRGMDDRAWADFNRNMQELARELNRSFENGFNAAEFERRMERFEDALGRWADQYESRYDSREWREYERAMENWSRELERKMDAYYNSPEWREYERAMEKWGEAFGAQMESQFDNVAWREYERAMEAWGQELGHAMETQFGTAFQESMKRYEKDMEVWGEEFGKSMEAWSTNFGKSMEAFGANMEKFGLKMEEFGRRMEAMKEEISEELVNDGLISHVGQKYKLELKKDGMYFNGKKQSDALTRKYREIVRKHNTDRNSFSIKNLEYELTFDNDDRN